MEIPSKIEYAAERLREGHRLNRITVRDFLRHFGVERRGAVKVERIREILDRLELETEPDFEHAWIDEPIWLRLKEGVPLQGTNGHPPVEAEDQENILDGSPAAVQHAEEQSKSAPLSAEIGDAGEIGTLEFSDPTFRIGSLPAAKKPLITVNENNEVSRAITLMLQHDVSQLPVMQGEREVRGVVTWKSIGLRKSFGAKCDQVAQCREEAAIADAERTLFDSIPQIIDIR